MTTENNDTKIVADAFPEQIANSATIEIRDLTVQAGERTLLDAASCTFPAGELILLLGCSGVGK